MIRLGEVKLVCIYGSVRDNSLNKKLLELAARMSRQRGTSTSVIDLSKYRLPLLTGEASEPRPALVEGLRNLVGSADGLIIASPEYNGSIRTILKNTIDWISRYEQGDEHKNVFNGKFAALLSCAPGALGGPKGLRHIQEILQHLGINTTPKTGAVPLGAEAFNELGDLKYIKMKPKIESIIQDLIFSCSSKKPRKHKPCRCQSGPKWRDGLALPGQTARINGEEY